MADQTPTPKLPESASKRVATIDSPPRANSTSSWLTKGGGSPSRRTSGPPARSYTTTGLGWLSGLTWSNATASRSLDGLNAAAEAMPSGSVNVAISSQDVVSHTLTGQLGAPTKVHPDPFALWSDTVASIDPSGEIATKSPPASRCTIRDEASALRSDCVAWTGSISACRAMDIASIASSMARSPSIELSFSARSASSLLVAASSLVCASLRWTNAATARTIPSNAATPNPASTPLRARRRRASASSRAEMLILRYSVSLGVSTASVPSAHASN